MTLEVKNLQLKPAFVEAVQFIGGSINAEDLTEWVTILDGSMVYNPAVDAYESPDGTVGTPAIPEHILLDTPMGVKRVNVGDWIVRDAIGKFFSLEADVLTSKYEEVL